jgi:hypothetical protein
LDSEGKTGAVMDSPNGKEGPETLSFVATVGGSFTLAVKGFDAKAEKGIYIIKREPTRTATAQDRRRVEVERVFVEGMALRDTGSQRKQVTQKLDEARIGWKELRDDYLTKMTTEIVKHFPEQEFIDEILKNIRTAQNTLGEGQQLLRKSSESISAAIAKFTDSLVTFKEVPSKSLSEIGNNHRRKIK